ncbi:hypothetical protein AALO_G00010340 [Alosa alosa]|uniref:ATP synthase F0 subunit 8 n=1 Tax=Alosa alosa TaxID=278164 RepID=A0AAV6HKP9_9TELE|nr:hypothetical protein AALO_G00010340 [Alosa alosa]
MFPFFLQYHVPYMTWPIVLVTCIQQTLLLSGRRYRSLRSRTSRLSSDMRSHASG